MRQLLSKILAGGLSAAVVLLWYPQFFPGDSVESWLIRGVVWTLTFELLLHAFSPFEESLWETRAGQRVRAEVSRVRPDGGHMRGRTILAGGALLVPIALLALAPPKAFVRQSEGPTVQRVTEVQRIVRVERVAAAPDRTPLASATPATTGATAPAYRGRRTASGSTTSKKTSKPRKTPVADDSDSDSVPVEEPPATTDAPASTDPQQDPAGAAPDGSETPAPSNPRL